MDLYAENILDHYKHPRHHGILDNATVTHEEKNLSCGDAVKLSLMIKDGKIESLGWKGTGCAISQAAMSIFGEELIGKNVDEAASVSSEDILKMLSVPIGARRMKCALLGLHTLKNALHSYKEEPLQSWTETVGNE